MNEIISGSVNAFILLGWLWKPALISLIIYLLENEQLIKWRFIVSEEM